jgi:hypothetical protein
MQKIIKPTLSLCALAGIILIPFVVTYLLDRYTEPAKPITYVTEEYVRCIGLVDNETIGNCLNELAVYSYDSYGPLATAEQLDTLSLQDRNLWCHESMHYMGWYAYQTEGSVAKAFLNSSELCDSGMYHGVMEEYLRANGLEGNIEGLIATVCADALKDNPDASGGTKSLCYHGLGHGLMYITGSDLQKSLDYCDALQEEDVDNCYSGAFMENTTSKQIGPASNNKDLKDYTYCENLKEHQKTHCYSRQGSNNFSFTNGLVKPAMEMCLELDPQYQPICFRGVGVNNPAPSKTHTQASLDCQSALEVSKEAYVGCIEGSMGFVVQLDRGEPQGAVDFCNVVYEEFKPICYHAMHGSISYWLQPGVKIEDKCALIENQTYRMMCVAS